MIQSGNLTSKAHYEILYVEEDSSFEEIHTCYRSSILSFHPDKMLTASETSNPEQESGNIRLEDLSIEDAGDVFELSYDCRCGDYFVINSSELADIGYPLLKNGSKIYLQTPRSLPASVVLPCGSCSLKALLLINADSKLQTELSN
ncbi:DNAJ heat shock N-terminal domain-containing protein [Forsythia ovata]